MLKGMHNVGIVVEDLPAMIAFFTELGLELEGEAVLQGDWPSDVTGLDDVVCDIAMMRTPDGHGRLEMSSFRRPAAVPADPATSQANALGIRRLLFEVEDIEGVLDRLRPLGAEVMGTMGRYEDTYLMCYLRCPEGIIIALTEQIG